MTNSFKPDPVKFGKLVRDMREAKSWNQSNLADVALSNSDRKSAVSDIEKGKKKLTTKDVRKFLTALDATQDVIDHWLGITPSNTEHLQEQLSSLQDQNASLEDAIEQIKTANIDGLELLARRFRLEIPDNISEYDLRQLLTKQAEQFQKLKEEVETLRQKYPQLGNIISEALATLETGDTAAVRKMVRQRREVLRDAHLLDGLKQDADLVQVDAQALIVEGDVQQAYDILTAAADSFASIDPLEPSRRRNTYGNMLYDYGLLFAGNALGLAAQMWGKAAEDVDRAQNAELWADLQNNLGTALSTLGERESGTAQLEAAVQACHNALTEWTKDKTPQQWAATQNNLGNALSVLGKLESSTARLEQAVDAHHNALTVHTQDKVPLDWATTQNNLGSALQTLGELESDTVWLEQAVAAYHKTLCERTQEKVPLKWAMTQNNLGNALQTIGRLESDTTRLEQAAEACRNALRERTQEKAPLQWAVTQNNLGNALLGLGELESGTARLEQAVAAYNDALVERTQDKIPLEWAMTQGNLGGVYLAYFDKTDDPAHLETAETHAQAALAVFEQSAPHYVEMAQGLLQQIAERRARR